jgi:CHAT domain-containing protein
VRDQRKTGHRPLDFAGIEAKMIAHLTGTTAIDASNVTRAEFQSHLREAEILHLGTHGYNDADYPFNSSILLGGNNRFRVLDMLAVRTELALVTFSACLSGLGRPSDLADVDGFSHAVLAAGANAYLGALWEVDDFATMVHMYLFYVNLFVLLDTPSLAEAWHIATRMLYELKFEDKIRILESFLACWDTWEARGEDPGAFVRHGKSRLEARLARLREDSEASMFNFKRPFVWAAFALVGNGSMRIRSSLHGTVLEMMGERGQATSSMQDDPISQQA